VEIGATCSRVVSSGGTVDQRLKLLAGTTVQFLRINRSTCRYRFVCMILICLYTWYIVERIVARYIYIHICLHSLNRHTFTEWPFVSFVSCLSVTAGAAAGVAAGFNAPIAGVFFALEIAQGDFSNFWNQRCVKRGGKPYSLRHGCGLCLNVFECCLTVWMCTWMFECLNVCRLLGQQCDAEVNTRSHPPVRRDRR
jgi:hypothetical protein